MRFLNNLRMLALVSLAMAANLSCVDTETVTCASGLVCPPGASCAAAQDTCIFDECGNAILDPGEICDQGDVIDGDGCSANCLSDESCGNGTIDVENPFGSPEVCDDGNTVDEDETVPEDERCAADCRSNETCGNGIVDLAVEEVCDDGNNESGDGCRADCKSDETCGNAIVDLVNPTGVAEECDDGNDVETDDCLTTCLDNICGDGFLDEEGTATEICDDGNTVTEGPEVPAGSRCRADCQSDLVCGNNVIDAEVGEVCDDGNTVDEPPDALVRCSADCSSGLECGNGSTDPGEQCDPATGTPPSDAPFCDSDCTAAFCGDGHHNATTTPAEQCDTAGESALCNSNCTLSDCGDDIVNASASEQCEVPGPATESMTCDNNCSIAFCGDGDVNSTRSEECDGGTGAGPVNTSACDSNCTFAFCGDGTTNPNTVPAEQCDAAGESSVCDTNCTTAACGDGDLNPTRGETCDDGNIAAGDDCRPTCVINICGDGDPDSVGPVTEACDDGDTETETACAYGTQNCTACNATCTSVLNLVGPFCGDNIENGPVGGPVEACDDGDTVTETACDYDTPTCSLCNATCSADLNLTGDYCGDGSTNGPPGAEVCDDGDEVTETACDYGTPSCSLCDATCDAPLALIGPFCGDSFVNGPPGAETCDDGNAVTETTCPYGDVCTTCDATCDAPVVVTGPFCGDGTTNGPEACDDDNTDDETTCPYDQTCTTCNATCSAPIVIVGPTCGDGVVNGPAGTETCDDGNELTETTCPYGTVCTTCNATCTAPVVVVGPFCGDGDLDSADGEVCDDSNDVDETVCAYGTASCTGCSSTCTAVITDLVGPVCGDGVENGPPGEEACDDGNELSETGAVCDYGTTCERCDATCDAVLNLTGPHCGDGVTQTSEGEVCDDDNNNDETDCPYGATTCTFCDATCDNVLDETTLDTDVCGDGTVDVGFENCDDNNTDPCGTCNASCQIDQFGTSSGSIQAIAEASMTRDVDGARETLTIDDGINTPTVFEFDDIQSGDEDDALAGRIEINGTGGNQSASSMALRIRDAINSVGSTLSVTAAISAESNTLVILSHDLAGAVGNEPITETVVNVTFVVTGMSGGAGADCASGTQCNSNDDCAPGLVCDTTTTNTCVTAP